MTNFLSPDPKRPVPDTKDTRPTAPPSPGSGEQKHGKERVDEKGIPREEPRPQVPPPGRDATPSPAATPPASEPARTGAASSADEARAAATPNAKASEKPEKETPKNGGTPPKSTRPPSRFWAEYYGPVFLLLVAAFIVAGFFLLRPLILEYKQLRADATSMTTRLRNERGYLDSLLRSIAAAQSIPAETLADVDEALPRDVGIPKLLETLARLAEADRISLSSVQFSTSKPSTPMPGVPVVNRQAEGVDIAMSVAAPDYASTRRFLNAIERNLRVFDIQTIAVSADAEGGTQSYSIQLRTYVFSTPSVSASAPSGANAAEDPASP